MLRSRHSAVAAALAFFAVVACATILRAQVQVQPLNVKLGLWEVTQANQMSGMPAVDTSRMTPEQRARVEALLKGRGNAAATPLTTKMCITQEKLNQEAFELDPANQQAQCKRTLTSSSSTLQVIHMECPGGQNVQGDIRVQVVSSDHALVTWKMAGNNGLAVNGNADAKWSSASCGDVK